MECDLGNVGETGCLQMQIKERWRKKFPEFCSQAATMMRHEENSSGPKCVQQHKQKPAAVIKSHNPHNEKKNTLMLKSTEGTLNLHALQISIGIKGIKT